MMRATLRRLSPLLLLAIAFGLLLLSSPPVHGATGNVSFGLFGTGDGSVATPRPETVEWQQFQPGAGLDARVTDPDADRRGSVDNEVPREDVTWKWYRGNAVISGATTHMYTVVAADVGHRIRVEATYRVRESYDQTDSGYTVFGPRKTVRYTSPNRVQAWRDPKTNNVPVMAADTVSFKVSEGATGNIGRPVRATDPDGDILTYAVRGTDANISYGVPRFLIDNATGQLRLAPGVKLDDKDSYEFDVRAYDSSANNSGAETDAQVTVETAVTIEILRPTLRGLSMSVSTSEDGTFRARSLSPSFDPETEEYTATVEHDVTHVNFTATTQDRASALAVEAKPSGNSLGATSGRVTDAAALTPGAVNFFLVRVTSESGSHTRDYMVKVARLETGVGAGGLSVDASPACGSRITNMSQVPTLGLVLNPRPSGETATQYSISGRTGWSKFMPIQISSLSGYTGPGVSHPISWGSFRWADSVYPDPGFWGFEFRLTNTPTTTASCYWLLPGREGEFPPGYDATFPVSAPTFSSDATLRELTMSVSTGQYLTYGDRDLFPSFDPDTGNYTVTVEHDVSNVKFTATANYRYAALDVTVRPAGTYLGTTSGRATDAAALTPDAVNNFRVRVVAEDGITHKDYYVKVARLGDGVGSGGLSVDANPACGSRITDMSQTPDHQVELDPHPGVETGVQYRVAGRDDWLNALPIGKYGAFRTSMNSFRNMDAYPGLSGFWGYDWRLTDTPTTKTSCYWLLPDRGGALPPAWDTQFEDDCDNCATLGEQDVLQLPPQPSTPPTAVTLTLGAATVSEDAGSVTVTATLDQPVAPYGGIFLVLDASSDSTATEGDDYTKPAEIRVAGGQTSGSATIAIVNDAEDEDDETIIVSVDAFIGNDILNDTATITIEDDDTSGVTVSAAGVSVTEGEFKTYTVTLTSQPTHDVTIEAASSDWDKVAVFPAAHTIDPDSWEQPKTFTVIGLADDDGNDESVAVSHRATSQDGKYSNLPVSTVAVTVTDSAQDQGQQQAKDYSELIAKVKEWRNDPAWVNDKTHTDRWDRVLLALGETVADTTLTPMTADEAQTYADKGWQRWVEVAKALKEIEDGDQQQQAPTNNAPTVSAAIADVTIVNAGGTQEVSLGGVFSDADGDSLTISVTSTDEAVATAGASDDQSTLLIIGVARGTATITVTADDGNGGTVEDTFTVTVKAAPVVASAIGDVSGLEAGNSRDISLSGVFSDADGDALTITAQSSDGAKATVSVAADYSKLTLAGVAEGAATITVTARDADGNQVSDAFDAAVVQAPEPEPEPEEKDYSDLIAKVREWRNDPQWVDNKEHTDRWDRVLLALGETVADTSLTPMTAAEAQELADKGWQRWVEVAKALKEIEAGGSG